MALGDGVFGSRAEPHTQSGKAPIYNAGGTTMAFHRLSMKRLRVRGAPRRPPGRVFEPASAEVTLDYEEGEDDADDYGHLSGYETEDDGSAV